MIASNTYYYLRPGTLDLTGYCYGISRGVADEGEITVERMPSGRWRDAGVTEAVVPLSSLEDRMVTEAEAQGGVGTYMTSYLCVARGCA